LPRAALLAAALGLVPLPAFASDPTPAAPKAKTIKASMQQIVAREAAKMPVARKAVKRADQDNPTKESTSFFKTGPGIAALAVMGAGVGYALYSASHDRVHSPAAK
jgi:hypothetical protein